MSSAADRWRESQELAQRIIREAVSEPPRFGACVYCGLPSGYSLACGAHLRILALDPTYSDSAARMRESDVLPETDEDGR